MTTPMICKLVKAGQKAMPLLDYIGKKAFALRANLGFGEMRLRRNQLPWAAKALRAFHPGSSRGSEVRHIIFSVPKNTIRKLAVRQLYSVFADWRKAYVPDCLWVAAIHKHAGAFHLHTAISNRRTDGRAIKFRPYQVKQMAAMEFTKEAISAKGLGKSTAVSVYPKARKLAVRDLAEILVDSSGKIRDLQWEAMKMAGTVSDFRLRKDGSLISFQYENRRIRFSTLKHFVTENQPTTKLKTMPHQIIKPTQPLGEDLASKLHAIGFSKDGLSKMTATLADAHSNAKRSFQKSIGKQITTPKL